MISQDPRDSAAGQWSAAAVDLSRNLYVGLVALSLVSTWLIGVPWVRGGQSLAAALVGTLVVGATGIEVAVRGFRATAAICFAGLACAATLVAPSNDFTTRLLLPVLMGYVGVSLTFSTAVLVGGTMVSTFFVSQAVRFPGLDTDLLYVEALAGVACATTGAVVIGILYRAARLRDAQAARSVAAYRAESEAVVNEAQARWVDHFLHDELVHALRAVQLGDRLTVREVQHSAHTALEQIDRLAPTRTPRTQNFSAMLQQVCDESGLEVSSHLSGQDIPLDAAQALAEATREALRNVRLHSGTDHAQVRMRRSGRGVLVEIIDEGVGFDPRHLPSGHYGVRRSIRGRVEDAGGTVQIASNGQGTKVRLRWSSKGSGLPDLFQDMLIGAIVAGGPFVLLDLVQCALVARHTAVPALAVGATAAVAGAWALAAVHLRRRAPTSLECVCLNLIALAAATAAVWAAPAGTTDPMLLWLPGGVVPLLVFGIVGRPWRESLPWVVAVLVAPSVVLLARGTAPARLVDLAPALWTPGIGVVVTFFTTHMVGRFARARKQDERLIQESYERQVRATARERMLRERVSDLHERIAPFLRAISDGSIDIHSPSAKRSANVYEARVRDGLGAEVTAWTPEIVPIVDVLRARGASLTMSRHAQTTSLQTAVMQHALRAIETVADEGLRVLVSVTPRPVGSLVAITATPFDPEIEQRWQAIALPVEVLTDQATHVRLSCSSTAEGSPRGNARPEKTGHAPSTEKDRIEV